MAEGWRRTAAIGWTLAVLLGGVAIGEALTRPPAWPSYADLYERVAPVVVNVSLTSPEPRIGSGFAIDEHRVVTARHLVVGADEATIKTVDGQTVAARVVGTDARTDLALLEADDATFMAAELGSAAELRVGDTVLAIGNPYGLGHSLAVGVVGSLDRRLAEGADGPSVDFLQLTIPLNPGNSGGPVFDERGRVAAVLSGTHAQGQAIAFAVPIEALRDALPALEQGGQLSRAFLGFRTEDVDGKVRVAWVVPASPADRAGVRQGDVVASIDGEDVGSPEAFHAILDHLTAGTTARLAVVRDGQPVVVEIEASDWAAHPLVVAGMTLQPVPGAGGEVTAIRPRSRAERAGIQVGDVVRTVDGLPVQAPADVQERLANGRGEVEVLRDGVPMVLQLPDAG